MFVEIKKNGLSAQAYCGYGDFQDSDNFSEDELEILGKEVQNRVHRALAPILYDYVKDHAITSRPVTIKNIVRMLDLDYGIIANEKPIGKIFKELENEGIFGIRVVQFQ